MQVNGIIAEYNPFHNGHFYHLNESRARTGADYTVVVMSGNFVQRGTPAIVDKFARAEMALHCGADLVLEIPAFYACGGAEYFASASVSLLDQLGIVDNLCFGSEEGSLENLQSLAVLLAEEPPAYRDLLADFLSRGHSFPAARNLALSSYRHSDPETDRQLLQPNNILSIEYLKALHLLHSQITPVTIPRSGAGYHEAHLPDEEEAFASASGLRHQFFTTGAAKALQAHMPAAAFRVFSEYLQTRKALSANDLSDLLLYRLLQKQTQGYAEYLDVSSDLSDKIQKHLYDFTDFESFCSLLKSKDLTYARISRSLLHILLDITQEEVTAYRSQGPVPYARVLGLNKNASPLLSALKANSSIPLISKPADADKLLSPAAASMLRQDIRISQHYYALQTIASPEQKKCMRNEYRMQIPIIARD